MVKKGQRPAESFLSLINSYETSTTLPLNTGSVVNLFFWGLLSDSIHTKFVFRKELFPRINVWKKFSDSSPV
jgi:hypothetical protein